MKSKTVDKLLKNTPQDVKIFVEWCADLLVLINQLLREKQITKKELAEKMDKSPSEVSKWLSGEHNFTLRSLAKLSSELDVKLLEVPKRKENLFKQKQNFQNVTLFVKKESETIIQTQKYCQNLKIDELTTLSNVG